MRWAQPKRDPQLLEHLIEHSSIYYIILKINSLAPSHCRAKVSLHHRSIHYTYSFQLYIVHFLLQFRMLKISYALVNVLFQSGSYSQQIFSILNYTWYFIFSGRIRRDMKECTAETSNIDRDSESAELTIEAWV